MRGSVAGTVAYNTAAQVAGRAAGLAVGAVSLVLITRYLGPSDYGKYTLALMFSQVLVIWYGNLPEETSFVFYRLWGEWRPISILVLFMIFVIPFWGLIWVKTKLKPLTLGLFSAISLGGVWVERYLLIQPSLTESGPAFGLAEIGVSAGFLGLFLLAYGLFAHAFPLVSPRLVAEAGARTH